MTTGRTTTTEKVQALIDETSVWDVLNALQLACRNMTANRLSGLHEVAHKLDDLKDLAFTYKL